MPKGLLKVKSVVKQAKTNKKNHIFLPLPSITVGVGLKFAHNISFLSCCLQLQTAATNMHVKSAYLRLALLVFVCLANVSISCEAAGDYSFCHSYVYG